jgi:hypothetical protein
VTVFDRRAQKRLDRAAFLFAYKGFERHDQGKGQREKTDHKNYERDQVIQDQVTPKAVHEIHRLTSCIIRNKRE